MTHPTLPASLTLGPAALAVSDLDRSVEFYTNSLGMTELTRSGQTATVGVAGKPLIQLTAQPDATPQPPRSTGLYHIAILLPTRADLGHALLRVDRSGWPFQGFGDHFVSEAAYLADPDGNGLELYRDRPRETWRWDGPQQLHMGTAELDVRSIVSEVQNPHAPWMMPAGTVVGHLHLRVGDVAEGERFYHALMGFDITVRLAGSASFMSAGGYHHHLGTNQWQSRGASAPPASSVGLRWWTVELPSADDVMEVEGRLNGAGIATRDIPGGFEASDPWGTAVRVVAV
ncbi:MAG: VOC family protein [Anaerolineae bacterium]|jgi:catechol 2,3-dioxygenase|nr:VOC family protein [Anaerolineae bacterium]